MDIKDFILIGGGLLIAAVIAHGFWIAWRAHRDPLRLDLVKNFAAGDGDEDDLRRLRSELPNGGARVVGEQPRQAAFELGSEQEARPPEAATPREPRAPVERPAARARKTEPRLGGGSRAAPPEDEARPAGETPAEAEPRTRVADVILPERPIKADEPREPREPRRFAGRRAAGERAAAAEAEAAGRPARGAAQRGAASRTEEPVEELVMINVLAPRGQPFTGGGVIETLRARGLRYGDMNIFHRVDPMSREILYSVANVVEPGTFDLADPDSFRSPGVCFFMQLPGPEQPMDAFEDMLKLARDVAVQMGGSLLDEKRSVMTGQTVEHYRQRISDFCRRRMSMRA